MYEGTYCGSLLTILQSFLSRKTGAWSQRLGLDSAALKKEDRSAHVRKILMRRTDMAEVKLQAKQQPAPCCTGDEKITQNGCDCYG